MDYMNKNSYKIAINKPKHIIKSENTNGPFCINRPIVYISNLNLEYNFGLYLVRTGIKHGQTPQIHGKILVKHKGS